MKKNKRLEQCLGYSFSREELLVTALSHRSIGKNNNERLEFLGDSLLSLIITEALFEKFSTAKEGDLSRLRSSRSLDPHTRFLFSDRGGGGDGFRSSPGYFPSAGDEVPSTHSNTSNQENQQAGGASSPEKR